MKSKELELLKIFPPDEKLQKSKVFLSTFGLAFLSTGVILGFLKIDLINSGIIEFFVLSSMMLFAFSFLFSLHTKNIKASVILSLVGASAMSTTTFFLVIESFHLR